MKICDACGSPVMAGIGMGGAYICRQCDPEVRAEMDSTRSAGKPVNVMHIARRIYKETHSGGNYLLRDVPTELMDKMKHQAIDEKCSVRDLILKSLYNYIK